MKPNKIIFLLRIAIGWVFFYAGITKVLDPEWSAAFYLKGAKTLPELYAFFLRPDVLPYVNLLNKWGLTLIGVSLILGAYVRWSAAAGALMMALYYLPGLDFPKVGEHSMLVDEHIVYALVLALLAALKAGRIFGLDRKLQKE